MLPRVWRKKNSHIRLVGVQIGSHHFGQQDGQTSLSIFSSETPTYEHREKETGTFGIILCVMVKN